MNSFVNVQIRVIAGQAQQRLAAIQQQVNAMGGAFMSANAAANRFGGTLDGMRLDSFGSRIQWIGRQLEYNFTLPILAAAAASYKLALDNEAAFTRVVKVYGDAAHGAAFYGKEIEALERNFTALSSAYGVNQKETIEIGAAWAAAGASGVALAKSVDLTMQTMILGELKAAEATDALIAIQAQYGFTVEELTKTIAILNMTENQTGISLAGLVQGFARAAGVARSAGVDVRHLAAMLAALTPAAGSAAQAGNALKTIFSRLLAPTKETTEVLALMGIHMTDNTWKSASMTDRLNILAKAFEDLSDSQKNVVSSVVASRWQINKFEILMRELTNTNGYYYKSLQSTADAQAVMTQMQRELNTVLSSNPRRLQTIWVMLQNAAADIIQPMIPLLLYLAQTVQTLVQNFSELSPGVQKFVVVALLALAAFGPLIRYAGAFIILIAELSGVIAAALVPFRALGRALLWIMTIPVARFFQGLSVAAVAAARVIGPAFVAAMRVAAFAVMAGWQVIIAVSRAGFLALASLRAVYLGAWLVFWRVWGTITGTILGSVWFRIILPIWVAGFTALRAVTVAGLFAIGMIWRGALFAIAMVTNRIFWLTILASITAFFRTGLLPLLRTAGTAIVAALTGPWGVAVAVVATILIAFWDEIKTFVGAVVDGVIAGWNALPQAIRDALMSVVNIVRAGVMKVYELMSYLNPWARHSPSLIDNITTGVAEIIRQFSLLTNVGSIFMRAGTNLNSFAKSLSKIRTLLEDTQLKELRSDIASVAPQFLKDFDNIAKVLRAARNELRELRATLPLEEMKAMADAIFENEMATKALRLQMMDMEDAIGPLDELQSQLDAVNGQIELLTGQQAELRNAGAGSEILSQYEDQIAGLEDTKSAIETAIQPLLDLQDQIEQLERAAERLSLEQSLAFDPILRQVDELTQAIGVLEEAMQSLSKTAQSAGGAGGGMSPGAQNFIDAAGGNFPDVGGFAQIGREGGLEDQSKLIDEFTKELADKTKNMFGMFDFLEPVKKGWNNAVNWLKSNIGPGIEAFWGAFTDGLKSLGNPFGGLDFGTALDVLMEIGQFVIDLFGDIWEIIGPPIKEIGKVLSEVFGKALEKIGPELKKFKDLVGPIQELLKQLWAIIKPLAIIIGGALLLAISIVANVISNVLGPVIDFIIAVIAGLIRVIRGVIEFLVGVFTGDWELAWQGIKDIFGGIWDIIVATIKGVALVIWGIVKGIGEGIWNFLKLIWSKISDTVKNVWTSIQDYFGRVGTYVKDWVNARVQNFKDLVKWVGDQVKKFVDGILGIKDKIGAGIKGAFDALPNGLKAAINAMIALWNKFDVGVSFSIPSWVPEFGGRSFSIPDIFPDAPYLARGGLVASQAMAIVGEGRKGYPEYVIPTDPTYRKRALMLFGELAQSLGIRDLLGKAMFFNTLNDGTGVAAKKISLYAAGGKIGSTSSMRSRFGMGITYIDDRTYTTVNFYGDLEFPNVEDGSDAEDFIENLKALVGEG